MHQVGKNFLILKSEKCALSKPPKRIKELTMKKIWPEVKKEEKLLQYLPDIKESKFPLRNVFFLIFATVTTNLYALLMRNVIDIRNRLAEEKNEVIQVSQEF